jgi:AmmeMemoRadiSam system protein B
MAETRVRGLADKVGFAHLAPQMDAVMRRLGEGDAAAARARLLRSQGVTPATAWRAVITPHDDYTYASFMYPLVLANVRAPTVVVFGVAHKARQFAMENRIVFDSFTHWHGCYGDIAVSPLREELIAAMPKDMVVVHDELQAAEHSVEAKLPFLQHYNRDIRHVSILVPAMPHARMREIAPSLAEAIARSAHRRGWSWGRDFAIVISTDAVHYGDEDWGGRNFAKYGADQRGYEQAVAHDRGIMKDAFADELTSAKSELFSRATVREDDWREYKWTWCGRYSVPFGMLVAWNLQQVLGAPPLVGKTLGYATSLDTPRVKVDDLDGMGVTAPANLRHWVGYASVGYL